MLIGEIRDDLKRAKEGLESAERNLQAGDFFTAANRIFVACENAVYVLLKSKFGSSTISRLRIITQLNEIDKKAKKVYDESYDMRVQADYGRASRIIPLTKENVERVLNEVKQVLMRAEEVVNKGDEMDVTGTGGVNGKN